MCISATRWNAIDQNAAGTRRAEHPQKDFCLLLVILKVGPTAGVTYSTSQTKKLTAGDQAPPRVMICFEDTRGAG
jgi:hypothetical protein